jgi:hypothetical protein
MAVLVRRRRSLAGRANGYPYPHVAQDGSRKNMLPGCVAYRNATIKIRSSVITLGESGSGGECNG